MARTEKNDEALTDLATLYAAYATLSRRGRALLLRRAYELLDAHVRAGLAQPESVVVLPATRDEKPSAAESPVEVLADTVSPADALELVGSHPKPPQVVVDTLTVREWLL